MKFISILLCLLALALPLRAADSVGWRTDGTGLYPGATPAINWSKEQSVIWKTPTEHWGNAMPVIVGKRMFVSAEPAALVCLNLDDGRILWQQSVNYLDILTPEQQARAAEEIKQADALTAQLTPLQTEASKVTAELVKTPDNAELKQKQDELARQMAEINEQLKPVSTYQLPKVMAVCGYTSPTPVSAGSHVWSLHATGIVACYDLEGKRQWIRLVEKPGGDWGQSSSPLLINGRLLIHIRKTLYALDPKTGATIWQAEAPGHCGTPALSRIGDLDLIITPMGDIIRVSDGKVLPAKLSKLNFNGPLVAGDKVFLTDTKSTVQAFKLVPDATDGVQAQLLWTTPIKPERYYASSLFHDGLLYVINAKSLLSVFDAATGELVYAEKLDFGNGGVVYPSIALAGGNLFASHDSGVTVIFKPGRTFQQVAKNVLTPFRATPVFLDKRMYVRAVDGVWCIGE